MQKQRIVAQAEQIMGQFYSDLETIVNIDSGTYTKTGIDHVARYLQARFHDFGFSTAIDEQEQWGNNLIATRDGSAEHGPHILLLGHTDTVFPAGEAARRPFVRGERDGVRIATGPGILDMKAGLLIGMYGLHILNKGGKANYKRVTCIYNSDEEIGSLASRPLIEKYARQVDAVIVLEPGRIINTIVSSRKGIGRYCVEVHGISAHAGVEPHKGRNAVLELAHQVIALQDINGTIPGVTLNVGIIRGGERINIIPEYACCEIDVRVANKEGARAVEDALRKVTSRTVLDGTKVTLSGGIRSLPFERGERSARLVQLAKEAGKELGLKIEDVGSGGASDANTTAGLGVPTVDGLGAAGGLAHNAGEYIELDSLPTRIALLTHLVQQIGDYYQRGKRL